MKKIILFIVLLFGFVALSAQTVTLPAMAAQDKTATYQYVPTDYTLSGTTVRYFVFTAPQAYKATQDFVCKMDTTVGTNHTSVAVKLQGQKSAIKNDWTDIGSSVTWHVTGKDTVIIISDTTANRYRNYRSVFTGVGDSAVTKITDQELKLYLE